MSNFSNYAAIGGPNGTTIKPGGRVAAYVRSTGAQDGDDHFAASGLLVASLNDACRRCRPNQNDIIYVLPGHVETISAADGLSNLVAGTQIIGAGTPGASNNPTITWGATAATLLLDVANVTLAGLNLNWIGVDNVVVAIPVTAAGCSILDCVITAESASAGILKGIEVAAGGSGFRFCRNTVVSVGEAHPLTSAVVLISGAADDILVADNYIAAANPGTNVLGHVAVTAAATNVRIVRNTFIQLETAGTALYVVTVGDVASTGYAAHNFCKIGSAVTATTSGFTVGTAGLVGFGLFENYVTDTEAGRSGVLSPVVAA